MSRPTKALRDAPTTTGAISASLDVVGVGLSSIASQGNPGAIFDYLWVSSAPIDFNPVLLSSAGVASTGAEGPF